MSLCLAIDTATDRGSVAVGDSRGIAAEVLVGARRHASALTPAVQEVLRLAGASVTDISEIIVADGPGSFTGLRIGFATAQGLARTLPSARVWTAPSLLSAAWIAAGYTNGPVAALYDALRGDVYAGVYQFDESGCRVLVAPILTTIASLCSQGVHPQLAVGDGALAYAAEVREWTGRAPVGSPAAGPQASGLIQLMNVRSGLQPIEAISEWEPNYGRAAEAQVRWEQAHGKPLPGSVGDAG